MLVAVDSETSLHSVRNLFQHNDNFNYHQKVLFGEQGNIIVSNVGMGLSFRQTADVVQVTKR